VEYLYDKFQKKRRENLSGWQMEMLRLKNEHAQNASTLFLRCEPKADAFQKFPVFMAAMYPYPRANDFYVRINVDNTVYNLLKRFIFGFIVISNIFPVYFLFLKWQISSHKLS